MLALIAAAGGCSALRAWPSATAPEPPAQPAAPTARTAADQQPSSDAAPATVLRIVAIEPAQPEPLPPAAAEDLLAPPAEGITLGELLLLAREQSPALREASLAVAAARAQALQAGLYPNPKLISASPQLAGHASQYAVLVEQNIVTHGKLALDRAAALRAAEQAELAYVQAQAELTAAVRRAFAAALAAERRAAIAAELAELSRRSRETGQRLFEREEVGRPDVLALELEEQRSAAALENARTEWEVARRQLAAVVAAPHGELPPLVGELTAALPDYELAAVQAAVALRHSDVLAAQAEVGRAELLLRRAQVEPLPDVSVQGGYQYSAEAPHQQGLYQVSVDVPLWDRNQGNIRAAQANVGAAQARLRRRQNELAGKAAAAVGRYLIARQTIERYQREVLPRAQENLRLVQHLYQEGQIDVLRLLTAERSLTEARLTELDAQERCRLAAADIGGLLQETGE